MDPSAWTLIVLIVIIIWSIFTMAKTVPEQWVYVVERLGKYLKTLEAGFHILLPFLDKVAYKHSLKEMPIDVPEETYTTMDNRSVKVESSLVIRVFDPIKASYGGYNYKLAIKQLIQTTLGAEIGNMTHEEILKSRRKICSLIVNALEKAADPWGIKIIRYEIKNIVKIM